MKRIERDGNHTTLSHHILGSEKTNMMQFSNLVLWW
jgi:hypothetical protein